MARSRGTSKKMKHSARDDAAYYQAHKDDPDEWAAAEPGPTVPGKLEVVVSVRFSANEERNLRKESAKRGQTLSSFIRAAALAQSRTGDQGRAHLSLQAVARTQATAFGGQIVFPGGTLRLSGQDAAAAAALPIT